MHRFFKKCSFLGLESIFTSLYVCFVGHGRSGTDTSVPVIFIYTAPPQQRWVFRGKQVFRDKLATHSVVSVPLFVAGCGCCCCSLGFLFIWILSLKVSFFFISAGLARHSGAGHTVI